MGKVIFTLVLTLVVGLVSMVLGIEFFGGYPELGAIVSIAVASGLIVYFNNKKVGRFSPLFLIMDGSEFLFLHFLHLCRQIVTIQ